jgi:hypothetical protein
MGNSREMENEMFHDTELSSHKTKKIALALFGLQEF